MMMKNTPTIANAETSRSALELHYANVFADRIGDEHGLTPDDLERADSHMANFTAELASMQASGDIRWRNLPHDPMRSSHLQAIHGIKENVNAYFADHTPRDRCKHMVVLGIGGSALGNIALQAALKPHTHNLTGCKYRPGPRLYVLDNVDPQVVLNTMEHIERADPTLEQTMVNVISKSGETAETAAQFMIFRNWLKEKLGDGRFAKHIVAVTDPSVGTMRSIVDREGYQNLPVPDGVGGRFSVLSPVGLFSAAMGEIDIEELLTGAADMDNRCKNIELRSNPAALLAWMLIEFTRRGKPNHVMMSYSNGLYLFADWFRQLWAESLGKQTDRDGNTVFAGATPIKALGTTDQHSQVQLYREGPHDKVLGFLEVGQFENDVTIPTGMGVDNLAYLEGQSLAALLNAEKRATEFALVESNRPNFTIKFPVVNAYTVGQFIQLWQVATAYAGLLLNIDAYDQPAVETGKKATFGLMGKPGFDDWQQKVDAIQDSGAWVS